MTEAGYLPFPTFRPPSFVPGHGPKILGVRAPLVALVLVVDVVMASHEDALQCSHHSNQVFGVRTILGGGGDVVAQARDALEDFIQIGVVQSTSL